ncbi:VWFA and cache domain-containing protein 1 [Chionoecetes opilio]|uniref:VWFA and cache domain-containing protein 1 n=1 Tax=Chionoecetes opilio TaxID=41210 RepID=A0A8J5D0A9_CHIOP|nr:VWFA and cache domain-containing protein 1 [Chionoecetes opilio]
MRTAAPPYPAACSGRSTAALLTTLLPLAVSLLVWASQSQAQESRADAGISNSSRSLGALLNGSEGIDDSLLGNKPIIYVNDPKLLKEMQEQSSLHHTFRLSAGGAPSRGEAGVLQGGVPLLERSAILGSQLRHLANNELGVTHMQATFDELPYSALERQEEETVRKMVQSLERKFSLYSRLLSEMCERLEEELSGEGAGQEGEAQEYRPCCLIPDNYLEYRSHFGTRVNEELWCDTGFGSGEHLLPDNFLATPYNLTQIFALNLRRYPTITWQYFMSAAGLHTEYPAHRPGTSIGSDCGQSNRHRHVYEGTLRPRGRNIVLLYDLGEALTPRLLITAKAIGHQVISSLTLQDKIALVGVAGSVARPAAACMRSAVTPATHDVKQTARHFMDYLEMQNEPTNHTLGLMTALSIISQSANGSALLMYVSRGVVTSQRQVHTLMASLATRLEIIKTKIVISTFGLGLIKNEISLERQFLAALSRQDFKMFNIEYSKTPEIGNFVGLDSTLSVSPYIHNMYDVVEEPPVPQGGSQRHLVISDPYWDDDSQETVVSLTKTVRTEEGKLLGVIGLDLPLANLLEDVTHFTSPAHAYAFVMDARGSILGHPKLGRPESWTLPLVPTDVMLLEQTPGLSSIRPQFFSTLSGHTFLHSAPQQGNQRGKLHYWWHKCESNGWVMVVAWHDAGLPRRRLSRSVRPLPPTALFHRLDLLSPSEARVCRHFNQMATLDGSTLFLSVGSYVSPLSQLASGVESLGAVQSITAYLSDNTQLIANPGLRLGVRTDATALYQISDFWKKQHENSDLSKYIVRRYAAASSGVALMFPGTLLDRSFDPRSQSWYLSALASPGKVMVSAPYLDPGGAGYIVTVSHTVYQGESAAMHSPADPVAAVLAADFTLGYFYKILLDLEPACGENGLFDPERKVRCFLVNSEGYLVAHPSLLDHTGPTGSSVNIPPHITHQEPVLSMELLGRVEGWLTKASCGRWWHGASERHYSLHLPASQVAASPSATTNQGDSSSCLQYALASVPSTNLILTIINQTCTPSVAFCPCSMDDRLCLNCQLVEAGACECPCECPLSVHPCGDSPDEGKSHLWSSESSSSSNDTKNSANRIWQTYFDSSFSAGQPVPQVLELTTQPPDLAPTCHRDPEPPVSLQYSIGLLAHLDACVTEKCSLHVTPTSCLGVMGCVWCYLNADGSSLGLPHCREVHHCYGGILGGPSPYPHGLATLPHSDNNHGDSGNPIGPVAGGVMAVFLVVALAVYCYKQHVSTSHSLYTPTSLQPRPSIYQSQPAHDIDGGDDDLLDVCGVGAAAAVSPYRMNPGYRRPPGVADSSDQGYSTMTPHDDSENLNYTDLGGLVGLPASHTLDDAPSSSGWSPPPSPDHRGRRGSRLDPSHTLLPPGKRSGPNIIQVPVTVHMVDTV